MGIPIVLVISAVCDSGFGESGLGRSACRVCRTSGCPARLRNSAELVVLVMDGFQTIAQFDCFVS